MATPVKVELIERLADAGLRAVEATSFVSPKWVPQLADAAEILAAVRPKKGVSYPVLTPNMKVESCSCLEYRYECVVRTVNRSAGPKKWAASLFLNRVWNGLSPPAPRRLPFSRPLLRLLTRPTPTWGLMRASSAWQM